MQMKPQDLLVTLKILASGWPGSYALLGKQLGLSSSEAHAAINRARKEGLLHPTETMPNKTALAEFLLYGLRYVFPAELGSLTRGLPTSYAAPPLAEHFSTAERDDIPVWPVAAGERRGYALPPLYRSVPQAVRVDAALYGWLALVDALRAGRARERELAARLVRERLAYDTTR
jgi:hypothetical protein